MRTIGVHIIRQGIALLTAGVVATFAEAGDVLVVSSDGSGDHTTIQAAVDAAADGDVLLVRRGVYPAFAIVGKGLSVVAAGSGFTVEPPGILVQGTVAGQSVLLAGARSTGLKEGEVVHPALDLVHTEGSVRVEDCHLVGGEGQWWPTCDVGVCPGTVARGGAAVRIARAPDVSFARCSIQGGEGLSAVFNSDNAGGPGIHAVGSRISLYHSDVRGGEGGGPWKVLPNEIADGGDGGHGIFAADEPGQLMVVHISDTTVQGGAGGDGGICCLDSSGDGGHGVLLATAGGPGCRGLQFASTLAGGTAGCSGACGKTFPGAPLVLQGNAAMTTLPGSTRSFRAESPVRAKQSIELSFTGLPGDHVTVVRSTGPGFLAKPAWGGVLHFDPLGFSSPVYSDVISAVGRLTVSIPAFGLPPGAEGREFYLQAIFRDVQSGTWVSTPATPVVIEGSF